MLPAALVSLAMACALLLGRDLPAPGLLAAMVAAGALGAGLAGGRRGLLIAALVGLVTWRVAGDAAATLRDRWPETRTGQDITVQGSVCEFPRHQPGAVRFVLETAAAARLEGVPARILVTWYDGAARPEPGQAWRLRLRLKSPRGLANPAGFDFERWLFSQRIGATAWVRDDPANGRLDDGMATCRLGRVRARLAGRMSAALGDREATPYVLGLTVGAYQALPDSEWEELRRTGTVHLVSISGFHLALVAWPCGFLGWLLARALLAAGLRVRPLTWGAWVGALAAGIYGLLAGFSVPTARSVVMLLLVAVLLSLRRRPGAASVMATVVVVLLLLDPLAPLVPGFWLSFGGVLVLVWLVDAWQRQPAPAAPMAPGRALRAGWQMLRTLLVTQVLITVALAPLLVSFFGQLPVAGALANLVAVPAFSVLLVPLSLLGAALAAVSIEAATPVLALAAACVDQWRAFVAVCAAWPAAVWPLPSPGPAGLALAMAGVVLALWPAPWPGRGLGLVCLSVLLGGVVPPVPQGGLRITVIDVGQGQAVLLETARHALMYDAGPAFRGSDAGQRAVVPLLQSMGLKRLDMLLVSHADLDHRGGAASILGSHPEARLLGGPVPGWPQVSCTAGMAWTWDQVRFAVVHPPPGPPAGLADNDLSCVLLVTGPGGAVLLPGDLEANAERTLVEAGALGPVDLVLAPHHGSRSSSSMELVRATAPRYVVFSTGFANRWRFPAAEVRERWRAQGACPLNTASEGALRFVALPGQGLSLQRRERAAARGLWVSRPPAAACD